LAEKASRKKWKRLGVFFTWLWLATDQKNNNNSDGWKRKRNIIIAFQPNTQLFFFFQLDLNKIWWGGSCHYFI
jgi:hypothetical protein